jgi:PAS domain S-box-containing protein
VPTEAAWALLDGAPDATLVADQSGQIVYANRCTQQMLGWAPAELIGRSVDVLIPAQTQARHRAHVAAFQREPRSRMMGVGLDLAAARRDGTLVPVEIALYPYGQGSDRYVVVSIRDISERVRLSEQLTATTAQLAVVDERDRIARDLHDRVIQQLFASGLHLQAALGHPDQERRVASVIDEIDDAIKEIRTTIFTIHSPRGLAAGCEAALSRVVVEAARLLGHQPQFTVSGDTHRIPADLVGDLVDVTRELLANVAKHAKATTATVGLTIDPGTVTLVVSDDGIEMNPGVAGHGLGPGQGLVNVAERAARRGGHATFVRVSDTRPANGTEVVWTVPLPS